MSLVTFERSRSKFKVKTAVLKILKHVAYNIFSNRGSLTDVALPLQVPKFWHENDSTKFKMAAWQGWQTFTLCERFLDLHTIIID